MSTDAIIGFSMNPRYLGFAILVHGRIVSLRTIRLHKKTDYLFEKNRLQLSLEAFLKKNQPKIVVAVERHDPSVDERTASIFNTVSGVIHETHTPFLNIQCAEIAECLGLEQPTYASIRRYISSVDDVVAAHLMKKMNLSRSELDRYWENAIVGAAGALAIYRRITE